MNTKKSGFLFKRFLPAFFLIGFIFSVVLFFYSWWIELRLKEKKVEAISRQIRIEHDTTECWRRVSAMRYQLDEHTLGTLNVSFLVVDIKQNKAGISGVFLLAHPDSILKVILLKHGHLSPLRIPIYGEVMRSVKNFGVIMEHDGFIISHPNGRRYIYYFNTGKWVSLEPLDPGQRPKKVKIFPPRISSRNPGFIIPFIHDRGIVE